MNQKFDELAKRLAQSVTVTRRQALKRFGVGVAGYALARIPMLAASTDPLAQTSVVSDAAGDAAFPSDLYGSASVPPYLDVIQASVRLDGALFHFEIKMSSDFPANPDPGFSPSVNHLGAAFGILTDRKTASRYKFLGQPDSYYFNFLVGAYYFVQDGGLGLGLGWHGLLKSPLGFSEIPVVICEDTIIVETSAASLGDPASFCWALGCECTPVPDPEETNQTLILVDYAPNHGYASWPAPQL
jgi:hypothetical protein